MNTYEQKYKEALGWMRSIYPTMQGVDKEDAEHYFPELRESEDEKIIRTLKEIVNWGCAKNISVENNVELKDCLAWLEKQGEQKPIKQDTEIHDLWVYIREWNDKFGRLPKDEDELAACIDYVMKRQKLAEWNEDDEKKLRDVISLVEQGAPVRPIRDHYTDWLKSLKDRFKLQPKQEWSEEDETVLNNLIYALANDRIGNDRDEYVDWLKSLKPHWKPSEEQLRAIINSVQGLYQCKEKEVLLDLYEQLKNL